MYIDYAYLHSMIWACDEKRGALRRNDGDGNESTMDKEQMRRKGR